MKIFSFALYICFFILKCIIVTEDAMQTCLAIHNNVYKAINISLNISLSVPWRLFLQVKHLVTFMPFPRVKGITTTIIIDSNSFLPSWFHLCIYFEWPILLFWKSETYRVRLWVSEYVLWDCFFTQLYAQYSFLSYWHLQLWIIGTFSGQV